MTAKKEQVAADEAATAEKNIAGSPIEPANAGDPVPEPRAAQYDPGKPGETKKIDVLSNGDWVNPFTGVPIAKGNLSDPETKVVRDGDVAVWPKADEDGRGYLTNARGDRVELHKGRLRVAADED